MAKKSNVILLVNPSHAHAFERTFWEDFSRYARTRDYLPVELAFRQVDPFKGIEQFVYPARLTDLSRRLASLRSAPLPAWSSEDLLALHIDWERRRWQQDGADEAIRAGAHALAVFINHVIQTLAPAAIVTTNKIDHPNRFACLAAKHYGIVYRFAERSPLDTYIIEREGMFAESQLKSYISRHDLPTGDGEARVSREIRQRILQNPYGFRADEASGLRTRKGFQRPLFFLPLDNMLWTGWAQKDHPQGDMDYPVFRDPEAALGALNHHVTDVLGGTLLIKPHPSCREWLRIAQALPDLKFVEDDVDALCDDADVVVTFLTKVAFLGLAKGKPVVSFGAGLLDGTGTTYEVGSTEELSDVLRKAAEREGLEGRLARFESILPAVAAFYFEDGAKAAEVVTEAAQDTAGTITPLGVSAVHERFAAASRQIPRAEAEPRPQGVIRVLFDVTRLLDNKLEKSGISRYARHIARNLSRRGDIEVTFCYSRSAYAAPENLERVRKDLGQALVFQEDAFRALDREGREGIYHSPVHPLPVSNLGAPLRKVITIHDVLHLSSPLYDSQNHITSKIVDSIDLDNDAVVFDSRFSMSDFEALVGRKNYLKSVVHLAAEDVFFSPDPEALHCIPVPDVADRDYLVFAFQNDPRKAFARMVRIACGWLSDGPERAVIVFGGERTRPNFNLALNSVPRGLRDRFFYLAELSDAEMAGLYAGGMAQLYLSEAEGFGLPPLEAMAAGCPSILLDNTSLSEVYAGWPLMLDKEVDDAGIRDALKELEDEGRRAELCEAGRRLARKYSWQKTVDELCAFYRQVLARDMPARSAAPLSRDPAKGRLHSRPAEATFVEDLPTRPFYAPFGEWLMWRSPRMFRLLRRTRRGLVSGYGRLATGLRSRAPTMFRVGQMGAWCMRAAWRHKIAALVLATCCMLLAGLPFLVSEVWPWRYLLWTVTVALVVLVCVGVVLREMIRRIARAQATALGDVRELANRTSLQRTSTLDKRLRTDLGTRVSRVDHQLTEFQASVVAQDARVAEVTAEFGRRFDTQERQVANIEKELRSHLDKAIAAQDGRLKAMESELKPFASQPTSLDVVSALRQMRPLWFGVSALDSLRQHPEVEHGHSTLMALLADEERAAPGSLVGRTLIEVGTTRERRPEQGSTEKLAIFTGMLGMRFVTVDMDPQNSEHARQYLQYLNPAAQAVTAKGEDYLALHAGPLEVVYLDAFDFDHGKHSANRQERYRQFLQTEIRDEACWKMHDQCAEVLIARMQPGGIVVVDDTWTNAEGAYDGKGRLAVPRLLAAGFEIMAQTRMTVAMKQPARK